MTFFNSNFLISILSFFLLFFILELLDNNKSYNETFLESIELPNYNKLDDSDQLKIIIDEIKQIIINNNYYGSKYKSDIFLLHLDTLCYDYLEFKVASCNFNNFKLNTLVINIDINDSLEIKKNKLNDFLLNSLTFTNSDNQIPLKVSSLINIYFNELIYNCG